jgi:hypothetical protein
MSEFKDELKADTLNEEGLTLQEAAFLDILFDKMKGNVRAAMDEVGYPKSASTNSVSKKLSKQIKERSKTYLISNTAKAVIGLSDVLTDPSMIGAKTLISAAKEVLDRGGIFKEEAPQVQEIRNMFILPAKDASPDDES